MRTMPPGSAAGNLRMAGVDKARCEVRSAGAGTLGSWATIRRLIWIFIDADK